MFCKYTSFAACVRDTRTVIVSRDRGRVQGDMIQVAEASKDMTVPSPTRSNAGEGPDNEQSEGPASASSSDSECEQTEQREKGGYLT